MSDTAFNDSDSDGMPSVDAPTYIPTDTQRAMVAITNFFLNLSLAADTPMDIQRAMADFFLNLSSAHEAYINEFISALAGFPDGPGQDLDTLLAPAFEHEKALRAIFSMAKRHGVTLTKPLVGLIDLFSIPPAARRTQIPPQRSIEYRATSTRYPISSVTGLPSLQGLPAKYLLPLATNMRRKQGTPAFVEDHSVFIHRLDIFTDGAIFGIKNWANILVAGGAILACVVGSRISLSDKELNRLYHSNAHSQADIDIFIYGLTPIQARARMEEIYQDINSSARWDIICVRKANTISIHTTWPKRTIQIVLRLYQSPAEVIAGFDIDASCFAFDGKRVYTNPRGLAAVLRQANTVDLERRSSSYETRLTKYADRGFEVYLPELDRSRVDYIGLFKDKSIRHFPTGLARLLTLEAIRLDPSHFHYLSWPSFSAKEVGKLRDHYGVEAAEPGILETSNYDTIYFRIHYGKEYDAAKIAADVAYLDRQMNAVYNAAKGYSRRLHRHAVFCGTMQQCLDNFCKNCPAIKTEEEWNQVQRETHLIRGPVRFLEDEPGRQTVGSIYPLSSSGWFFKAYIYEGGGGGREV